jgi:hypothetical protein
VPSAEPNVGSQERPYRAEERCDKNGIRIEQQWAVVDGRAAPLGSYAGTYQNAYYGALELRLGRKPLVLPL